MDPSAPVEIPYEDHELVPAGDGAELYYESYGTESPVITTINNFYLLAQIWRGFSTQLARRNRVVAWDLRNQGGSKAGSAPLEWDHLVEDLRCLLDHLEVERTYLLGSSISCLIARDFALKYPERVAGCIMQAPAFSPYGPRRREMITKAWLQTLDAYGTDGLWQHMYGEAYCGQTQEVMGVAGYLGLRQMFSTVHRKEQLREFIELSLPVEDGPDPLRRLDRPVLIQVGDGDFMWSPSQAEDTLALLRRGKLDTIPRAGHVATMENPQEFEASVQRFVDEVEAGKL